MNTLDLVNSDNVMIAVLEAVTAGGLEILEADRGHVKVKGGCLPVEITWEMCLCHGGRVWLDQGETGIHIELSSPEYDADNGIDSPETELAWRIDNELVEAVSRFERYVHVIDEDGSYGMSGRHERRYFDSAEKAAAFVFEEDGHDLLTTIEVTHRYPNPDVRLRVKYDRDESERDGTARRIHFKCERLERGRNGVFEVDYEFERSYWVYRKGLR